MHERGALEPVGREAGALERTQRSRGLCLDQGADADPRAAYPSARLGSRATAFSAAARAWRWPSAMASGVSAVSETQKVATARPAQAGAKAGSSATAFSKACAARMYPSRVSRVKSCLARRYCV